jgi:hypothetical protein
MTVDRMNRELEEEKRVQQNNRIQRTTEMRDEYRNMQIMKQQEKETKGKRSKYEDDYGTFKIGSENRSIRKKNYDDQMNSLVLNPTREVGGQNMEQIGSRQRGKSNQPSGFNIINHTNYGNGFENDIKKYMDSNYDNSHINQPPVYEKPQQPIYTNQPHHDKPNLGPNYDDGSYKYYENDNYEHLENYNKHYDGRNEIEEAEYQKYYQEYLNSLREANTKEQQPDYVNDLTNDMNKMNINDQYKSNQSEYKPHQTEYKPNPNEYKPISQNEYMTNKLNNQKGCNIYNLEGDKNNYESKVDGQKMYKSYLDAQAKDKRTSVETNTNQRFILKKDRSVVANPCKIFLN